MREKGKKRSEKEASEREREGERVGWWYDSDKEKLEYEVEYTTQKRRNDENADFESHIMYQFVSHYG